MSRYGEERVSIRDSEAMKELARRLSAKPDDGQNETTTVSAAEEERECPDSGDD